MKNVLNKTGKFVKNNGALVAVSAVAVTAIAYAWRAEVQIHELTDFLTEKDLLNEYLGLASTNV